MGSKGTGVLVRRDTGRRHGSVSSAASFGRWLALVPVTPPPLARERPVAVPSPRSCKILTVWDHLVSKKATPEKRARKLDRIWVNAWKLRTDDGELSGHEKTEEVEKDLQRWPFLGAEEAPCAG